MTSAVAARVSGAYFHLRGARTASPHLAHGFVNSTRDGGHIVDALAPLGDRSDDVELVVNLVQGATITPNIITLDLSGQEQDRRRSCVGCPQRRAGVLDTRPRHHEGHSWLPSHARIAISHIRGGLLMPYGHHADIRLPIEGIVDAHNLYARESKHYLYTFVSQGLYYRFTTGHLCHIVFLVVGLTPWNAHLHDCTAFRA